MTKEEIERNIAESFIFGMALGFASKYDEKDEILKRIREIIDEKENKRKFKVGDKVRTLVDKDTAGNELFPKGTIGTIAHVLEAKTARYPYRVYANGDWWFYNDDMIELVNDEKENKRKFKVGDKVRTLVDKDANGVKIFPKGKIGTITKILETTDILPYKVEADGDWWYYNDDMIELVDDKTAQRIEELTNRVEELKKGINDLSEKIKESKNKVEELEKQIYEY